MQSDIDDLTGELTELKQSLDTAQHSIAELKTTNKKLQSTISELNTSLEVSDAQIYEFKSQVSNNEFKSNKIRMEVDELKIQLDSKNRLLESNQLDVEKNKKFVAGLNETIRNLTERNAFLEKVIFIKKDYLINFVLFYLKLFKIIITDNGKFAIRH